MKRLTPPEQLVVLDAVLLAIGKLRDHANANGDGTAARRLDDEHTSADDSRQTLLWGLEADDQAAYAALAKALKLGAKKKPAKVRPRSSNVKRSSDKRARSW